MSQERVLVVDNGSYTVKFGFQGLSRPYTAINALARDKYNVSYLSNQINNIKDISSVQLKRPSELGQLVSWELQSCIWDYCFYNPDEFNGFELGDNTRDIHLVTNETCLTLPELSKNMDQVIFEEYEFASLYKAPTGSFVPFSYNLPNQSIIFGKNDQMDDTSDIIVDNSTLEDKPYRDYELVIDSGFNCTWIIPVIKGIPYYKAIKKLDIGGRFLNGLLKQTLSFRHYNMMDETILVNNIKEKTSFICPESYFTSFKEKNKHSLKYVLPDFQTSYIGYVLDEQKKYSTQDLKNLQLITLSDERFAIPETFFHPEMAELLKPGIVETILESVSMLPEPLRPIMLANIVCIGGNFNLPNFAHRLALELQGQLPTNWNCRIRVPTQESELFGWRSMNEFSESSVYRKARISREEYLEHGLDWSTKERFGYQNWM